MDYNVNGVLIECNKKEDTLGAVSLYCKELSKLPVPEQKDKDEEGEK